jgi:hypothetical protein
MLGRNSAFSRKKATFCLLKRRDAGPVQESKDLRRVPPTVPNPTPDQTLIDLGAQWLRSLVTSQVSEAARRDDVPLRAIATVLPGIQVLSGALEALCEARRDSTERCERRWPPQPRWRATFDGDDAVLVDYQDCH